MQETIKFMEMNIKELFVSHIQYKFYLSNWQKYFVGSILTGGRTYISLHKSWFTPL